MDDAGLHRALGQRYLAEVRKDRTLLAAGGLHGADGHRTDVQSDQVGGSHQALLCGGAGYAGGASRDRYQAATGPAANSATSAPAIIARPTETAARYR